MKNEDIFTITGAGFNGKETFDMKNILTKKDYQDYSTKTPELKQQIKMIIQHNLTQSRIEQLIEETKSKKEQAIIDKKVIEENKINMLKTFSLRMNKETKRKLLFVSKEMRRSMGDTIKILIEDKEKEM